jgi:hypothetical protein
VYFGEFLIISSISECPQSRETQFVNNKIECKWFSLKEAMEIDESQFVPGIKTLLPEAFNLIKINYYI